MRKSCLLDETCRIIGEARAMDLGENQRQAARRVYELACRQLEQDKGHLSGPSITLGMMSDVEQDDAALDWFKRAFKL